MMVLEFEKPLVEIQEKIKELRKISSESGMDLNKEIETFEQQAKEYKKELYANLKPAQRLQIARHSDRPNFKDYVKFPKGWREILNDKVYILAINLEIKEGNELFLKTLKGK